MGSFIVNKSFALKLSDIEFVYNDGTNEALYVKDFTNLFVNHGDLYNKVLLPSNFIILGRKGSGKTLLAEYLKAKFAEEPSLNHCQIKSLNELENNELIQFRTGDTAPNEYKSIWQWFVLLDIAQTIMEDESSLDFDSKLSLKKFFETNKIKLPVEPSKISLIERTKQSKFNISTIIPIIGTVSYERNSQREPDNSDNSLSYLQLLPLIKELIINTLLTSHRQYLLIFDELDDRFQNNENYRNSIISLIKVASELNKEFYAKNINFKIIILLRTDIYNLLNDRDFNKITQNSIVKIDWGDDSHQNSPLMKLVTHKASQSHSLLNNASHEYIVKRLFPEQVKHLDASKYLLSRTFLRPRDIITFLDIIKKNYSDASHFSKFQILDCEFEYSEYLCQEVKNEMCGYISDEQINQYLELIRNFNKHDFYFDDIETYFNENKDEYPLIISLVDTLKFLFNFNVIGQKWFNEGRRRDYYDWKYMRNNTRIFDAHNQKYKKIVVHLGLNQSLLNL
ncbi:hypothetical protein LVJ82_09870 [Vitreoscilla massiliensis]|uniref:AAA+ ATPase domain-containing protein n=1 Tax=Vitreoscilla massiliensis TaxID=1689272 RepID=A0ABY4DXH7_9NEIS|nr:hypothetical protein [Vitreoscilla massiliensis]UOO87801.1 hypothetical protein LVJ82_09870 [Vitreoscilla massiliensis]